MTGGEEANPVDGVFEPGEVIQGRYEVIGLLGEGGFAVVYRCRDRTIERQVAVKVLKPLAPDPKDSAQEFEARMRSYEERFRREASCAAQINHGHVVTVHDFGFLDGSRLPFIVMEYIEGHTLRDELLQRGRMSPDVALSLFIPCLEALGHAHQLGIVHKDLKPSNLILSGSKLRIVDFGVARVMGQQSLTATRELSGTLPYLAPEYLVDKEATPAVDVYQMGLILCEVLIGHQVVNAESLLDCLRLYNEGDLSPPHALLQTPLGPLLEKCLRHDPRARYQDGRALAEALKNVDPFRVREALAAQGILSNRTDPFLAAVAMPGTPAGDIAARLAGHPAAPGGVQTFPSSPSARPELPPTQPLLAIDADTDDLPSVAVGGAASGPMIPARPPAASKAAASGSLQAQQEPKKPPTGEAVSPVNTAASKSPTGEASAQPSNPTVSKSPTGEASAQPSSPAAAPGSPPPSGAAPTAPDAAETGAKTAAPDPRVTLIEGGEQAPSTAAPNPPPRQGRSRGAWIAIALLGALLVGAVLGAVVMCGGAQALLQLIEGGSLFEDSPRIPVGQSPSKGSLGAEVVVVVFSDLLNPAARQAEGPLAQIVNDFPDEVRLVYKHHFPRKDKDARRAAEASRAAQRQGVFWAYRTVLMTHDGKLTSAQAEDYARQIGLDMDRFKEDLQSDELDALVNEDLKLARRLDVEATPTIFVNGLRLSTTALPELREAVEAELKAVHSTGSTYAERVEAHQKD